MKIDILHNKERKVTSIFASTSIRDKAYYLKFNRKGWLELEYIGDNPVTIPAFLEMPDSISKEFLSELTLALGRYGLFAEKKRTMTQKLKELFK